MKKARILLKVVAPVAAAALSISACGGGSSATKASGGTVLIQVPIDPGSLDPQTSVGSWGRPVARFAYDTLLAEGPKGAILPELAKSWKATPTEVSLTLRDDVTCSDGSKLTAKTVVANFDRLKDPATKSPYTASFMNSTTYTATADDATNTVTLKLPAPFSPLLSNLTTYPQIICQAGLDNPSQLATKTFGTGPFVLSSASAGDHYDFTARKGYKWGPNGSSTDAADFPSKVQLKVVANETTAANLLLSGGLNIGIFATQAADRLSASQVNLTKVPTVNSDLQFNFGKADNVLLDKNVRRAIAGYVDRSALSQVALGKQQISKSIALPQAICGDALTGDSIVKHDPAASDQLLTASGWSKNGSGMWTKGGKTLSVKFLVTGNAGDPNKAAGAFVYDAWRKAGVDVAIQNADEKSGFDIRASGAWDVLLVGWNGVFNPAIISPFYANEKSATYTYLDNAQYTALAKQAYSTDIDQSCTLWNKAQEAIDAEVSAVPTYYTETTFGASKNVKFTTDRSYIAPDSLRISK
jgi:peptide/nickel transport system substrate-binding protein